MREEHAVCVKFTQLLVLTKQDPADFCGYFVLVQNVLEPSWVVWGIGLLLRIESAGSAAGLSRHLAW
jgi:hypothetical protein